MDGASEWCDGAVTPSRDCVCPLTLVRVVISLDIIGVSRIRFAERELTPSSPQLFALALYLSAESERRVPRYELQNLLFPATVRQTARSHSLRQLLYRLGSAGFPLECQDDVVWVPANRVRSGIADLQERCAAQRLRLLVSDLEVLPAYVPSFSPQLCDWVDATRSRVSRRIRCILEEDLAAFQRAYDWDGVAQISKTLLALDPLHYHAVRGLTESCLVRCRPAEALAAVNEYLDEHSDASSEHCSTIRRLRNRLVAEMRSPVTAPFIGRADCLAFLSRSWDAAVSGVSQSVLVSGAAGMGKSRVLAALSDYAVLRGARCVAHTCGSNDRHRPLALFAHVGQRLLGLRGALGISPLAGSQIARLLDTAKPFSAAPTDQIASEVARAELQDALVDLIDAVSTEGPLLLAVDDVHLLDSASWAVLREISRNLTNRPLMLLLCTRSAQHPTKPYLPERLRTFPLAPLSEDDSRTLLLALAPHRAHDRSRLEQDVRTSGGNPFLIHALARYSASIASAGQPLDIGVLAASSYYSLNRDSRTLLESVLHLRELGTLSRLRSVCQLDEATFLRSLRDLEEEGLLQLVDGGVECAHDLIADALRALTPRTVAAVLNGRIAARLEAEWVDNQMEPTLAWAAAQAWMSAGEPGAATRLLRRCAAHAATLGEAGEAAKILGRLLDVSLPSEETLSLTGDLIAHADVSGERHLRARGIEVRIRLLQEEPYRSRPSTLKELRELKVSHLANRLHEVDDLEPLLGQLRDILIDDDQEADQRIRAAVTLLISADLMYDRELAEFTWEACSPLLASLEPSNTHVLRVQLIFHTVFGHVAEAISIARRLLNCSNDSYQPESVAWSHRYALFALHSLGCSSDFHAPAKTIYQQLRTRKVYSACVYVANLIAERLVQEGDLEAAIDWMSLVAGDLDRVHPTAGGVTQGYYSTLASLASSCGRLQLAAKALKAVRGRLPLIHTRRLRSVDAALWMRQNLLEGSGQPSGKAIEALERAHELGGTLGRQDSLVEALWLAYRRRGELARSSALLREYLTATRREPSLPEWSLRYSTREDEVWRALGYQPASKPDVGASALRKLDIVLGTALCDV